MCFQPLDDDELVTATGGQIIRNTTALDQNLTLQLKTLQDGIKDLATSQGTNQSKQQQQQSSTMMMLMMMRNRG
jgi:ClpP class serine protease